METKDFGYSTVLFIRKDEDGTQFLLQKKDRGYKNGPDNWQLFGGRIEEGESAKETVTREIKEELNLNISTDSLKEFTVIKIPKGDTFVPLTLFIADFNYKVSEISLNEGVGFAFWYTDEIKNIKTASHELELFNKVIDSLN